MKNGRVIAALTIATVGVMWEEPVLVPVSN